METTKFERTYKSVKKAIYHTENLDKVIDFLRNAKEPVTCKEIGLAVFGDNYTNEFTKQHYAGQLGQMLRHLHKNNYVKMEVRKGAPVEIEYEDWVYDKDSKGELEYIDVFDIHGNKYKMKNPNYDWRSASGRYVMKKVTVVPKVKYWSLVD